MPWPPLRPGDLGPRNGNGDGHGGRLTVRLGLGPSFLRLGMGSRLSVGLELWQRWWRRRGRGLYRGVEGLLCA